MVNRIGTARPEGGQTGGPAPRQGRSTALGRLAGACYDRRRTVLVIWILAIIGMTVVAQVVGTHFENKFTAGNTPSQQASEHSAGEVPVEVGGHRRRRLPYDVAHREPGQQGGHRQGGGQPGAAALRAERDQPVLGGRRPPDRAAGQGQHRLRPGPVHDRHGRHPRPGHQEGHQHGAGRRAPTASRSSSAATPISAAATAAPGPSEGIGITAAILIMLLAFGSVVAMGLPVITALAGLGIGVALLELLTHVLTVPNFSPEMAAMIGIGVGIDYALFIVTRYRQGIFEGRDPRDAVVTSFMTSGRSVLFAGSTVVISLFGLYLIGQAYMIGLATACIAAVLMVLIAALTLLPAMLGFAGNAIDKLHLPRLLQTGGPPPPDGFWYRWSRFVQRGPGSPAPLRSSSSSALALPLFSMRLAFTDAGNDPTSLTTRQAYDLLAQGFGPGFNGPLVIAADMQAGAAVRIRQRRHGRPPAAGDRGRPRHGIAFVTPPQFNEARHRGGHHRLPDHLTAVVADRGTGPDTAQRRHTAGRRRHRRSNAQVGGQTAASASTRRTSSATGSSS